MSGSVPPADPVTLLIDGKSYGGWQEITIERGIDRCVSSFNVSVTERWDGQSQPWQIAPFSAAQVKIGNDVILTGYVESYIPQFDARAHGVRIAGHSKTKDLVDCDIDPASGQYAGYSVIAIARAVAAIYGITALDQTGGLADNAVSNPTLNRCETAFAFLERLGRLAGILLTDNALGNLVLTTAGQTQAASTLKQGLNVMGAHATISVAKRFSNYVVKGQAGIGGGTKNITDSWDGAGGVGGGGGSGVAPSAGTVQTAMRAEAIDTDVPRYRLHVTLAESQLSLAQMQQRANWQKQYAFGQATKATVRVQGFRQSDGTLWTPNQMVACTIPWLQIDADLLVTKVKFTLDDRGGHVTDLDVGPIEGYTPDPGQVRIRKGKHGRGGRGGGKGAINWSGAGGS